MFIRGVGTSAPATRYPQSECWAVLQSSETFARLTPRSRALLRRLFSGQNGIDSRALALDALTETFDLTPNALHARFEKHAPALATEAAQRALDNAGVAPGDIDAVSISTCTGYLCPGLTSYVSGQLGLRADVYHVLERALAAGTPSGWWWMSSFGADFSGHGALLKVD